jgi:hypothetical protein
MHAASLARIVRRIMSDLAERRLRAIAYRDLRLLDAHTMRDIGLSHRAAADHPSNEADSC